MPLQHRNLTDTNLKCFNQHGFKAVKESGKAEVYGNCIFCSGKEKFYINVETKQWNCKKCNKSGGFQKWLQAVSSYCQGQITGKQVERLSLDRKLSRTSIQAAKIGYNPWTNKYTLPIPVMDGIELSDIRIYNLNSHKFISTASCKTALFGWEQLKNGSSKIYLTEGEWDGLAMREAISLTKRQDEIVLSVPGAMTFKKEWISLFQGANVDVLYDNDDPGRDGSVKVFNMLQGIARELHFMHWKPNEKKGKDIRDLYTFLRKKPEALFKRLRLSLQTQPQDVDKSNIQITGVNNTAISFKGPYIPVQQMYDTYNKWLILENNDVLDILFGTLIANRIPGDPVWLLLVAQSGGVKSELIMSLDEVINVVARDSMTANTLISGMPLAGGGDPSLIPRLNGKILTIKDLTVIMEMQEKVRNEIISQLRNAYDGKASKELGNNVLRVYKSTFGILAGVTPKIDVYAEGESAIGERFLRWRLPEPKDSRAICRKALHNTIDKKVMRKELSDIGKAILAYDYKKIPNVSREYEDKIISLAEWIAMIRGTVERDKYSKEATQLPMRELPTRLTNQLYKESLGISMLHQKSDVTFAEFKKLKHLARSTVPANKCRIIEVMYTTGIEKGWPTKLLEQKIGLPFNTIERTAEDLKMLGALKKVNTKKIHAEWTLTTKIKSLMQEVQLWNTL